jgi:predicted transcriptional regulator
MGFKTFQISLDEDDVKKIDKLKEKTERSRSFLVRKAIILLLKECNENDFK